jgi:2-amino-4-hydroxy-6-hydroxymethyldihydropteridine diphosphokinase
VTARRAALGLGANLGDRHAALQSAVDALLAAKGVRAAGVSGIYQTEPVGGPQDQPQYLNAVLAVDTSLTAHELLVLANAVEAANGRVRGVRWGPRTLDIDVLAVGQEVSTSPDLVLPHPRAHERAFVLVPWTDVDPGFEVPGLGKVADLLAALPRDDLLGVHRVGGPALHVERARR